MSLSKKLTIPIEKLSQDTKAIENLLKSEGITDCEPGVLNKLLMTGYALIKDELLKRKHREEIALAVGNIDQAPSSAADSKYAVLNPAELLKTPMEIEVLATSTVYSDSGPNQCSSALISAEPLSFPNEMEHLDPPSDADAKDTHSSSNSDKLSNSPEPNRDRENQ